MIPLRSAALAMLLAVRCCCFGDDHTALAQCCGGGAAEKPKPAPTAPERGSVTRYLRLAGLDCAGCAGPVKAALRKVPGVRSVDVDFARLLATVALDASRADPGPLVAAVKTAGFEASVVETTELVLSIASGPARASLAPAGDALAKVPGVRAVKVDAKKGRASVVVEKGKAKPDSLLAALEKAGFKASVAAPEKTSG